MSGKIYYISDLAICAGESKEGLIMMNYYPYIFKREFCKYVVFMVFLGK